MPLHCWLLIILFPIATGATKQKRTTTFSCKVPLPLGMESGAITDAQLSASSSFEASSLGPQNGRIRLESGGGAWCPSRQIDADTSVEFIQVDLLEPFEIWAVEVQGRYGNGSGREFAEALTIDYIGEGQQNWTRYTITSSTAGDDDEQQQQQQETSLELEQVQQVFPANRDERTAELIPLVPPLLAVSVRLVPFSAQLRTVCLRFELYGCPAAGNANANDKLRFRDDNVNSIAGETVQSRGGTFSQLGEHVMARPALLYPLVALVSLLPLLLLLLLFFRWRLLLHRQRDNNGSNNKLSFFSCTSTCSSSNSNAHPLRPSSSWQNVLLPFGCVEQQSGGCSSAKIFSPSFCRFDTVSLGWPSLNRVNSNCTKTAATNWSNSFWQPQQMKISKSMITAPLMAAPNQQQQRPIPLPIPTAVVHSHSSSDGRFAVTRQATATQQPPQLIRAKKPIPKPRSSTTLLNKQQQKPGNTRN